MNAYELLASTVNFNPNGPRCREVAEAGDSEFWLASAMAWLPLATLPFLTIVLQRRFQPWAFMWLLAGVIFAALKWLTWWRARRVVSHSAGRSLAYLLAWPGMNATSFLDETKSVIPPQCRDWLSAVFNIMVGAALLWWLVRTVPAGEPLLRGWMGMLGGVLLLHFGLFQMASLFWRWRGIDAPPIMSAPVRSQSLSEFWGKRWNLEFRQLGHDFVFRPALKYVSAPVASFVVFIVSGLIHDLVISVPARGGYGLPTLYFAIQGAGVALERSRLGERLGIGKGFRGWFYTLVFAAGPVVCLFHPAFVLRVILPFLRVVHAI